MLLRSRWDLPAWLDVDDIEQELLLAAWRHVWKFDPAKVKRNGIEYYTVWNACEHTRKLATVARIGRRPNRGEGKGMASCYEIPFSSIDSEHSHETMRCVSTEWVEGLASVPPTQERTVAVRWVFERAGRRTHGNSRKARDARFVFAALSVAGEAEAAAAVLYESAEVREACQISSEDEALRLVSKTLRTAKLRFAVS
jgi:hypothetical protein